MVRIHLQHPTYERTRPLCARPVMRRGMKARGSVQYITTWNAYQVDCKACLKRMAARVEKALGAEEG